MIENAIKAARLDVGFYNTVENDPSYTQQAGLLVVIVGLLSGLGTAFVRNGFFGPILGTVIGTFIGWLVWSFAADIIGRTVFDGDSDLGQMMRVLGYASAPLALGVIPFLGFIGSIWALIASVVAIREGQDFTTGKAIGTVIIGWLIWVAIGAVLYAIF